DAGGVRDGRRQQGWRHRSGRTPKSASDDAANAAQPGRGATGAGHACPRPVSPTMDRTKTPRPRAARALSPRPAARPPGVISKNHSRCADLRRTAPPVTVTLKDIEAAARAIDGHVERTPLRFSRTLSEITGAKVWLKFENLQFTASFKERGALN